MKILGLVARLNDMAHREHRHNYDIGDYWNAVEEAAERIEELERELAEVKALVGANDTMPRSSP